MSIAINKLWIHEEDKPRRPDCQRETNYEEQRKIKKVDHCIASLKNVYLYCI